MERGVQQVDAAGRSAFLGIAAGLGVGVARRGEDRARDRLRAIFRPEKGRLRRLVFVAAKAH
jgi:hypothetical protein